MSGFPQTGSGGMTIDASVYASLPAAFIEWYRTVFTGTRMIYGHWSGGPYSRAVGSYHRQVAVLKPATLDAMIDKYLEARQRRIGGAIASLWQQVEEMKQEVVLQTFENASFDRDLPGHTRGRETGSVALALMCAQGARLNDLGPRAPLPAQLHALVELTAEACDVVRSPVERFMTQSEAADNLDFAPSDAAAPAPPCGFRTTREVCGLEAWIEPDTQVLSAPLLAARPGWLRLGDWIRAQALWALAERTRPHWDSAATSG